MNRHYKRSTEQRDITYELIWHEEERAEDLAERAREREENARIYKDLLMMLQADEDDFAEAHAFGDDLPHDCDHAHEFDS